MVSRLRAEDGALEGFVILAIGGLALFAAVVAVCGGVFIQHERARTAADFAALAAAQALDCAVASTVAARNGAQVLTCEVTDAEARVVVTMPTGFGPWLAADGRLSRYTAGARASI